MERRGEEETNHVHGWGAASPPQRWLCPSNLIHAFLFPIKIAMGFSRQLDRVIPKCTWNNKEHRTAKTILKKKEEEEGNLPLSGINRHYGALTIKMDLVPGTDQQIVEQRIMPRGRSKYIGECETRQRVKWSC